MAYKVEPLSRSELEDTLNNYVCSTCWANLSFRFEDHKWYAICPQCREDTAGYTSKAYAERRLAESDREAAEARHNLKKIMNLGGARQDAEKNLKDLGYGDLEEDTGI